MEAIRALVVAKRSARSVKIKTLNHIRHLSYTAIVTDKGLSGEDTEAFFAGPDLGLMLIRPARKDEKISRSFPNWLRQRIEAIIWALKNQLGLERHGGRVPAGLWARIVQRLLALNAAIWHNWQIGAPVKRSLIAYDHC